MKHFIHILDKNINKMLNYLHIKPSNILAFKKNRTELALQIGNVIYLFILLRKCNVFF